MDAERSPKRQRFNSYSPASPAPPDTTAFVNPQTPPPSVRMSPSWQSQNSASHKRTYDQSIADDASIPTPPSTAGLLGQAGFRAIASDGGEDPESQNSATGQAPENRNDHRAVKAMGSEDTAMSDAPSVDAENRRTDHERHQAQGESSKAPVSHTKALYKISATRTYSPLKIGHANMPFPSSFA
jgi:hypothetical protein